MYLCNLSIKDTISQMKKAVSKFIIHWHSKEPDILVRTSGSTGKPKTMRLSKKSMKESARLTGEFLNLKKGDRALLCLPIDFIAGKMMAVRADVIGMKLIAVKPSSNPLKTIDAEFDFAAMTPMQVYNILNTGNGYEKLNRIKNLIIGGGDIGHNLLQRIRKLNNKTYHTYGMTETITHVAMKKLTGPVPDKHFKALKNITFEKDGRDCLVINAPHISKDKIITNDIVELFDNTGFDFKGRFDNMINTGGIKVFPETVEKKLSKYIRGRFIIAGLPDEKLGEKVVLIAGQSNTDISTDIFSRAGLTKYETPKEIHYIKLFRETETGKIDRIETKKYFIDHNKMK